MSKNIAIQEGAIGKQLTVDKLKTDLVGGGSCLWVPEDETVLGTKNISNNGTYRASIDGLYGYSEVTVSGVGEVTGKDADGDNAKVTRDPITGNLTEEKVVESIGVVAGPTVTNYQNGETLDFTGLIIHGYSSTGRDLGAIPLNALEIQPTIAQFDPSSAVTTATSDLIDESLSIGDRITTHKETILQSVLHTYDRVVTGGTFAAWMDAGYLKAIGAKGDRATFTDVLTHTNTATGETGETERTFQSDLTYTHNGETVHYTLLTLIGVADEEVVAPPLNNEPSAENYAIAWTIVYGNIQASHSTQTITVSYNRPTDGQALTTTFSVSVTSGGE